MTTAAPDTGRANSPFGEGAIRTIGELRREVVRFLRPTTATPSLDARLLVAAAAGIPPAEISLRNDVLLPAGARQRALKLAVRRKAGEPVARILGEKEFWGLTFRLSPDTLVPRPDTETVIVAALAAFASRKAESLRILDIGTGSGAILLALLSELPQAFGVGTDRSFGALRTARENAAAFDLSGRATFTAANWTDPLRATFDLVVSNPPYIPAREIDALPVEVRAFDPHIALNGGADGLECYRAIVPALDVVVRSGSHVFLEVGEGQSAQVAALLSGPRFGIGYHRDLAGIERVVEFSPR